MVDSYAGEADCFLVGNGCGADFDVCGFLRGSTTCVLEVDEFSFVGCVLEAERDGPGDSFVGPGL